MTTRSDATYDRTGLHTSGEARIGVGELVPELTRPRLPGSAIVVRVMPLGIIIDVNSVVLQQPSLRFCFVFLFQLWFSESSYPPTFCTYRAPLSRVLRDRGRESPIRPKVRFDRHEIGPCRA